MEFDYDRNQIGSKLYSTSPTSSSSSSSTSTSVLSFLPPLSKLNSGKTPIQSTDKSTNNQSASMSSSTSQIFATAASFNICQNDTVYYSRETIHLIAKFLSFNGKSSLYRSLYAFAPDNLAWLWSFIDWQSPLDLTTILTQDTYTPFKPAFNITIDDIDLSNVNKLFLEAPLIQYKYREPIMIGDVYKFLEYVTKTQQTIVAKALFLIYFPRFSAFIDNPLKDFIKIKILKSNLNLIKRVDDTITSLINSRYPNINEYKQQIQRGLSLPSYIRTILKENNYPPITMSSDTEQQINDLINNKQQIKSGINLKSVNDNSSITKTLDYMKLLEQSSNKINTDLDHISFDQKKAILMQQCQQADNLNMFCEDLNDYDNGKNVQLNIQNTDYPVNCKIDENNNSYYSGSTCNPMNEIGNNFSEYQEPQLAAKCLDLINSSSLEQPSQELNLASLTLPQLNNLADSFSNSSSSVVVSPKKQNDCSAFYCGTNQNRCDKQSKTLSYSGLPLTNSTSPSSPKYNPKAMFQTPKTPSTFGQYQERQQLDYSVWSSSSNQYNQSQTKLNLSNNNRLYNAAAVTPPSSATLHKTSPLSVVTNGILDVSNASTGGINSPVGISSKEMLSPTQDMYKLTLTPNSSNIQDELNLYLKHQSYGSPVTRFNKFDDYCSNASKVIQKYDFDHSNIRTTRFNSNTDLNTNSNILFHRNDLFNEFNASKSPSSTSSGPVQPNHRTYSNSNYLSSRVSSNNPQNQYQQSWQGRLPPKIYSESSIYSRKVFLGGLPWDVNQQYLLQLLQKYGSVKLEIPGKDQKHPRVSNISKSQERSTPGYVYIIYEHESAVQRMLADCRKEIKNGGEHYYYTIFIPSNNNNNNSNSNNNYYFNNNLGNKRGKAKEVEVIPWNQEDTSYVPQNKTSILPAKIDAKTTIFVGALHGMLNAHGLAKVMNEVFGEVIHAGLDTDKYKYPIGSGRVTFRNRSSYVKAIKSKYVNIKANLEQQDPSPKFEKTIQIDPYLEDAKCLKCNNRSYYFCRNEFCLDYYCENCWKNNHDMIGNGEHQSLSRQYKPDQINRVYK